MATKKTAAKSTSSKASAKRSSDTKSASAREKTDSSSKKTSKANAKKTASTAPSKKKSAGRKYGPAASKSVEREMKAMHDGTLRSGSGQKVTNPKQAIAIGLSEARKAGAKMPPPPPEK